MIMSETTRIYTVEVTEIIKGKAEPKETGAEMLNGCIMNIFGADDVVVTKVQDFVMEK
jgi:hypothetical protein